MTHPFALCNRSLAVVTHDYANYGFGYGYAGVRNAVNVAVGTVPAPV